MDPPIDTSSISYKMPILSLVRDDTCMDEKEHVSSPVSTGARSKIYPSQSHYSVDEFDGKLQKEMNYIDAKINELRQSMDRHDERIPLSRSDQTRRTYNSSQLQSASSHAEHDGLEVEKGKEYSLHSLDYDANKYLPKPGRERSVSPRYREADQLDDRLISAGAMQRPVSPIGRHGLAPVTKFNDDEEQTGSQSRFNRSTSRDKHVAFDDAPYEPKFTSIPTYSNNSCYVGKSSDSQMAELLEHVRSMNEEIQLLKSENNKPKAPNYVKAPKYNGTGSILSFLKQFDICAEHNAWSEREKVVRLQCALEGQSSQVLWDFNSVESFTYGRLKEQLILRYGSPGQTEAHRAELRNLKQKHGEALSTLVQNVRKLMVLAYPGPTTPMHDTIAKDSFISALGDRALALKVLEKGVVDLDTAYQHAVQLEVFSHLWDKDVEPARSSTGIKVRAAAVKPDVGNNSDDRLNVMISMQKNLQDQMMKLQKDTEQQIRLLTARLNINERDGMDKNTVKFDSPVSTSKNVSTRSVTCFNCGAEGHIRPNCPSKFKNKRVQKNSHPQKNSGTPNSGKVSEQVLGESLPKVARVGQSYFVRMLFNGRAHRGLVDTGAEVSMAPARFISGIAMVASNRKYLSVANDTQIKVLGEVQTDVKVGNLCLSSKFLITDQIDEITIGSDWLKKHDCIIDLCKDQIVVDGVPIVLMLQARQAVNDSVCSGSDSKLFSHKGPEIHSRSESENLARLERCIRQPSKFKNNKCYTLSSIFSKRKDNVEKKKQIEKEMEGKTRRVCEICGQIFVGRRPSRRLHNHVCMAHPEVRRARKAAVSEVTSSSNSDPRSLEKETIFSSPLIESKKSDGRITVERGKNAGYVSEPAVGSVVVSDNSPFDPVGSDEVQSEPLVKHDLSNQESADLSKACRSVACCGPDNVGILWTGRCDASHVSKVYRVGCVRQLAGSSCFGRVERINVAVT